MGIWKALVNADGTLASIGTVVAPDAAGRFAIVDLGDAAPDLGAQVWDVPTRTLVARPAQVFVDRLADIDTWLAANVDFQALTPAQKTVVTRIAHAVATRLLGPGLRTRVAGETPELSA